MDYEDPYLKDRIETQFRPLLALAKIDFSSVEYRWPTEVTRPDSDYELLLVPAALSLEKIIRLYQEFGYKLHCAGLASVVDYKRYDSRSYAVWAKPTIYKGEAALVDFADEERVAGSGYALVRSRQRTMTLRERLIAGLAFADRPDFLDRHCYTLCADTRCTMGSVDNQVPTVRADGHQGLLIGAIDSHQQAENILGIKIFL